MKIVLIAPYINIEYNHSEEELARAITEDKELSNREDFYPSTALLHLAAVLRDNNHEPVIIDLNNAVVHKKKHKYFDYCKKIIIDKLNEHKPDLVALNCLFSGSFPDILELAKTVKSHSPNSKIAIGGIHPTTYPKEILSNCNEIDYIAIGEGENSIVSLAAMLKEKNENLLSSIKSFAFRDKDGEIRINRESNYIKDLDSLPLPAWDLIDINHFNMNLDNYYNPQKLPIKNKVAILSSRACPLNCNFCDMFMVMGKEHRKRGTKLIVDEIEWLNKSYGVNYFSFFDDNLTLNRAHILDLCNEILKRKLKIICDAAAGLWINSLREDVIAKMAEAGFVYAMIAVEHGNDYIRNKVIKKHLDKKKIFEIAELLKKYKIMTVGSFIMGFPEETNETMQDTYDMMNELQLDKSYTHTLIPHPGTALFNQVVKDKLFVRKWNLDKLWKSPIISSQHDFVIKPYNMSLDDLYKWREKVDAMQIKYWKTNPNPPVLGQGLSLDISGKAPRRKVAAIA